MMVLTALLALGSEVRAQADAVAPAQSEMQKWIDTTDGQWQAAFKTGITEVRETELKKVKLQYLNTLETAVAKVSGAGDLDGAVALRAEQKRFSETEFFPAQDEAGDAVAVKQIRVAIRAQLAQVEKDTGARTKALLAKYDQLLAQAQAQLTQAQRLDDALMVKAKRAEVAAAWGMPAQQIASPNGTAPATPKPAITLVKAPPGAKAADGLAKVEAPKMNITPLAKDEKLWSDRDVRLVKIPAKFKDYQFTQAKAHSAALQFKVIEDGLVYMGCTTRWGSTATTTAAKEFATALTLKKAGWTHVPGQEITTTANDMSWTIFSRQCKAGEEFTYRTEKYAPPILLVK